MPGTKLPEQVKKAAFGRQTYPEGVVLAVKAGPEFEIVGENDLGDICLATPLIAGGTFIARTQHYLIAIGK